MSRWDATAGQRTELIPPTYTDTASSAGTANRMEVRVEGSSFSFFINGTRVGGTSDRAYRPGSVGFGAGTFSDAFDPEFVVSFDNLTVYELA